MIATLTTALLAIGGSAGLSLLVKATLAMAIGLLALRIFRNTRASRRYLILASTFGVLAALPVVAAFAPPLAIPVRERMAAPPVAGPVLPAIAAPERGGALEIGAIAVDAPVERRVPSPTLLLKGGWAVGLLISLMPIAFTLRRVRELRRTSVPWHDGQARVEALARTVGLHRTVALGLHNRAQAPMTFGLRRPAILLPAGAPAWADDDLDRALRHELEHIRRADWPAHLFARAVCAAYWFHPLVWTSWRHFHLEADRACDDAVIESGDGSPFAEQLVTCAARLSPCHPRTILAMASRGDLSVRVLALLNARQVRGRAGARCAWAAVIVALVGGAALSPLRAVERQGGATADFQALAFQNERFQIVTLAPSRWERNRVGGSISVYGQNNAVWAMHVTIEDLIRFAYGVGPSRSFAPTDPKPWASVAGLPDWGDRYELKAHTSVPLPEPASGRLGAIHLMVQALLADRFELLAHWEPRSRPIYRLALAGGQVGPQMRRSRTDCEARTAAGKILNLGSAVPPELPVSERICGMSSAPGRDTDGLHELGGTQVVTGGAQSIDRLVEVLERQLGREVIDDTGLTGIFDIDLHYVRDATAAAESAARQWGRQQNDPRLRDQQVPPPTAEWPSLEDALRDQLGLRLEPERALGEVLAVDRVEKPALD